MNVFIRAGIYQLYPELFYEVYCCFRFRLIVARVESIIGLRLDPLLLFGFTILASACRTLSAAYGGCTVAQPPNFLCLLTRRSLGSKALILHLRLRRLLSKEECRARSHSLRRNGVAGHLPESRINSKR